jgi:hypothetical protein
VVTNISDEYITSIFRLKVKMEAIYSSKSLITTYKTAQCHNPEDENPNVLTFP